MLKLAAGAYLIWLGGVKLGDAGLARGAALKIGWPMRRGIHRLAGGVMITTGIVVMLRV